MRRAGASTQERWPSEVEAARYGKTTVVGTNYKRNWVQSFKIVDQGAEVGKIGNTFALEFVFPSNSLDNLADDLRQPPKGMGLEERDRIGRRRQEVAALADQGFQI